jgi:hypothetical protein
VGQIKWDEMGRTRRMMGWDGGMSNKCKILLEKPEKKRLSGRFETGFACFHSVMEYYIMFWGNLSNSKIIFSVQKKIVRIIAVTKPRISCRDFTSSLWIYIYFV